MSKNYAVIFTSKKKQNLQGYDEASDRMIDLVQNQHGFVDFDSVLGVDGVGITVSYWESEKAILDWKKNLEHRDVQEKGRNQWYESFSVTVCKVERSYDFGSKDF